MLPNLTTGRILGKLQANCKSKLPPCSLVPAEVAVPSTRQVYSTNPGYPSTTELHKQLDLEKSFHIYSFDLPYPSTNTPS
jgi:hypothetical protein